MRALAIASEPALGGASHEDLVAVQLWCTGATSLQVYGRFTCKQPVLVSGGTRIRTGGTMVFRFVPKPSVHTHRAPWAESKRFSEIADRRGPPPTAMDRHAEVVELW